MKSINQSLLFIHKYDLVMQSFHRYTGNISILGAFVLGGIRVNFYMPTGTGRRVIFSDLAWIFIVASIANKP